jgi:hypothetical protein
MTVVGLAGVFGGVELTRPASRFPAVYASIGRMEYWRFLPAGLKFVLAPFSEVEIVPARLQASGVCCD